MNGPRVLQLSDLLHLRLREQIMVQLPLIMAQIFAPFNIQQLRGILVHLLKVVLISFHSLCLMRITEALMLCLVIFLLLLAIERPFLLPLIDILTVNDERSG